MTARVRPFAGALTPLVVGFLLLQWLGVILAVPLALFSLGFVATGWPRRMLIALAAVTFTCLLLMAAMSLPWGDVEGGVSDVSHGEHAGPR